jgi:amino-acid N-acetyltransferase
VTRVIESIRDGELESALTLLRGSQLPVDGLDDEACILVARDDGRIVGTAALEIYPDGMLLRSVAITSHAQGQGLGSALTEAMLRIARDAGAPAVFLLTTTAEQFFPRFGFVRIPRHDVPASVQTSVEFTTACPCTAAVMRKTL